MRGGVLWVLRSEGHDTSAASAPFVVRDDPPRALAAGRRRGSPVHGTRTNGRGVDQSEFAVPLWLPGAWSWKWGAEVVVRDGPGVEVPACGRCTVERPATPLCLHMLEQVSASLQTKYEWMAVLVNAYATTNWNGWGVMGGLVVFGALQEKNWAHEAPNSAHLTAAACTHQTLRAHEIGQNTDSKGFRRAKSTGPASGNPQVEFNVPSTLNMLFCR